MVSQSVIKTSVGELKGIDCVHLDSLNFSKKTTLVLEGQIDRRLVNPPSQSSLEFMPFKLEFIGVQAFRVTEIEAWSAQFASGASDYASFTEVLDSEWIESLFKNRINSNRHYLLMTKDNVVEVICRQFKLAI